MTVIKLLTKSVKSWKKALAADTPKKRAKYKKHQMDIDVLLKLLNSNGRDYIVKGEI
jgi:hypothetical protein|tara:strand:- start:361 stop:531 length:171 start_codon:yes stop_codon:yes gene_type:complete